MFFNSEENISPLFLFVACLFVTCLLISNIIAGKLVQFRGIVLPAAVILFPLTYVFGDILTEVYGFRRARLVIWIGFIANLFMAVVFVVTIALLLGLPLMTPFAIRQTCGRLPARGCLPGLQRIWRKSAFQPATRI